MIKFLKLRGVLSLVLMLILSESIAQNFSKHNWYFGNSVRGIRFSRTDNTPSIVSNQFTPFGMGGSAVATDQVNANLLFYSDGTQVINMNHQGMTNGNGLLGNSGGNQPAAISPVPGQSNQYYVFTNTASFTTGGDIRFSIVDMSLPGGAPFPTPPVGAVTTKNDASINLNNRSEAMLTIPHANGIDYWLITHENGTDNYTSTLITATGFSSSTQNGVTGISIVAGNFSYHAATGKVAVTPQDANRNVVILNFDNTLGTFQSPVFVSNSATLASQDLYDTEWSADGRFLYISRDNDVVQYDLNNPTNSLATVLNSLSLIKSYGLQVAPDNAIYHLYESAAGVFRLGRLTDIDSVANDVIYSSNAFGGPFDYDSKQFPQFTASMTITPAVTFTYDGSCTNSPISFYPTVTPGADSLVWNFGDGGPASSEWSPVHIYPIANNPTVTVTPFLNGVAGTPAIQSVILTNFNFQLSLVSDTTACSCSLPQPQSTATYQAPPDPAYCQPFTVKATPSGTASPTYQWYGPEGKIIGATTLTLQPQSAGYYWLVATVGTCETYAGVNIREYNVVDQRANIWYFGNQAGIDFNEQPAVAISNPVMNAPEGTATISDRNGQVLFFTDGNTVWNRDFTVIGTGIGGDLASAQSSIIIPVQGDETLYYIFTTQDVGAGRYELRYSLYDIKKNGGAGGLVKFNQLLYTPVTERITSDGSWLIAHEYGNNTFRAYSISLNGIGNPVLSSVGSDHTFIPPSTGEGYMKLNGSELAVALSTGAGNFVEIFDFDNTTGEISAFRSANLNTSAGQVYGIEIVGDKIFATVRGASSSEIYEILDTLGAAPIVNKIPLTINAELGALQMGPDGQLYVAVNGASNLGAITVNPDPATLSTFNLTTSPALTGTSTLGLPNFAQSLGNGPMIPSYLITGLCLGSPSDFLATGTDPIDKFLWSITQGGTLITSSDQQAFSFTLPAAGTYTVTLLISNGCGYRASFVEDITIVPPPQEPLDVTYCPQDVIVLDANPNNAPGLTYLWANGATTETIIVTQQGNYPVTISTPQGCVLDASILAIDVGTPLDLGADSQVCSGATSPTQLDAFINTNNHDWYLSTNGAAFVSVVPPNNTQLQSVNLSTAGTFAYLDIYTNPITGCISRDTVTFTVNQSPVFTASASPIACNTNSGQISLRITQPVTSLFTYTLVPPTGPTTTVTTLSANPLPALPYLIPPAPTLAPGTYGLQVMDQITGCIAPPVLVPVNTNAFNVTAMQADACPDSRIQITPSANNTYDYIVRDAGLTIVDQGTFSFTGTPFTTTNKFASGNYNVELLFGGCTSSSSFTIAPQHPNVPVSFTPDVCNSKVTAQVTGNPPGIQYVWTTTQIPSGILSTNNNEVTLNPGTWNLNVTATDPTFTTYCPGSNTITVTVEGPVTPDIVPDDLCQDIVTLSAVATTTVTPPIAFDYQWSGPTSGIGDQLTTTLSGNYTLNAVSSLSGCVYTTSEIITILGLKTVTITSELPCEGPAFIITANPSEPVSSPYTWTRNGNPVSGNTNQISVDEGGLYKVSVFILGCPATFETPITLLPSPVGSLPNRELICDDDANPNPDTREVLLDANPQGGTDFTFQWYINGVMDVGSTDQTFLVTESELTYRVDMENSFGCTGTDETIVDRACTPIIAAPTAFHPGGANSTFYVFTYFVDSESFELFIYNRWGELVYQSKGLETTSLSYKESQRWNGGYKNNSGQTLPPGTYTYIIKFKGETEGSGMQEKRGGVVLLR